MFTYRSLSAVVLFALAAAVVPAVRFDELESYLPASLWLFIGVAMTALSALRLYPQEASPPRGLLRLAIGVALLGALATCPVVAMQIVIAGSLWDAPGVVAVALVVVSSVAITWKAVQRPLAPWEKPSMPPWVHWQVALGLGLLVACHPR